MQHEDLAGGHGVYRSIYLCWVEEVRKEVVLFSVSPGGYDVVGVKVITE